LTGPVRRLGGQAFLDYAAGLRGKQAELKVETGGVPTYLLTDNEKTILRGDVATPRQRGSASP